MATTTSTLWGPVVPLTITLDSLAIGAARQSVSVDLSTQNGLDVQLAVACKLDIGTPPDPHNNFINVFLAASVDGTNLTDNATGNDGIIVLRNPTNLIPLGTIYTPDAGAITYRAAYPSIAAAFGGGVLPLKFSVIIVNNTGIAFA